MCPLCPIICMNGGVCSRSALPVRYLGGMHTTNIIYYFPFSRLLSFITQGIVTWQKNGGCPQAYTKCPTLKRYPILPIGVSASWIIRAHVALTCALAFGSSSSSNATVSHKKTSTVKYTFCVSHCTVQNARLVCWGDVSTLDIAYLRYIDYCMHRWTVTTNRMYPYDSLPLNNIFHSI